MPPQPVSDRAEGFSLAGRTSDGCGTATGGVGELGAGEPLPREGGVAKPVLTVRQPADGSCSSVRPAMWRQEEVADAEAFGAAPTLKNTASKA